MNLLLDAHALIWWLSSDPRLSEAARHAIGTTQGRICVSAAAVWEIATKFRIGRLPSMARFVADPAAAYEPFGLVELPVTVAHARAAGLLPGAHRDPFDRMLIAQAMIEGLTLVSNEAVFDAYAVRRLW